ncbi:helix-turn-helix protein [Gelidibacter algens]|uniref:Helix-turn-helix protein n=1 Tax=Gelidibacter algens TaxID=49280 RepID=A0A327SH58_9FLAO|nr:helix-turn-helix domain-containing protein [Gelidibacter algens]RAJ25087.1 helix-turn-helix protein [Gelidibacter algens]
MMFYFVGVIITFFLAFILLSKRNKSDADRILFFWLLTIGIHLSFYYLSINGQQFNFPFLLGIDLSLPLIHGPFLYLYTASVTNQIKGWNISILHFLPVLISLIALIPFFRLPNEDKILVYKNEGLGHETLMTVTTIAIILSGIIYVIWSLVLLKNHRQNILKQFSYSEKINLYWLRYLILGIGVIWFFVIFGTEEMTFLSVVLFVIFIGYFGINQVGVFTQKKSFIVHDNIQVAITTNSEDGNLEFESEIIEEKKTQKYEKSGLTDETAKDIHDVLSQKMEEEKFFVNPELTLVELAQFIDVHPNNLSQVINTYEEKNFYDYINSKRIEMFKEIVESPESKKYTILSLAFDCGFNSKSSFNKYFKKETNLTPSEYIKTIK